MVLNWFVTADWVTWWRLLEIFSMIITSTNFCRVLRKPWPEFSTFLYLIKSIYFLQETRFCHSTNKTYSGSTSARGILNDSCNQNSSTGIFRIGLSLETNKDPFINFLNLLTTKKSWSFSSLWAYLLEKVIFNCWLYIIMKYFLCKL